MTEDIQKIYWTTSEVSQILGVEPSALRYWNKVFAIQVRESGSRQDWTPRHYRAEDVEDFKTIYNLLKVRKLTIPGALKVFKREDLRCGVPMAIY